MEDLSAQILAQTSENIQKLFDLSTRIDERVKSLMQRQEEFERRMNAALRTTAELKEALAILKSAETQVDVDFVKKELHAIEKRVTSVERTSESVENRWKSGVRFVVQIIWLVVGAWLLFKLGLGAPQLP